MNLTRKIAEDSRDLVWHHGVMPKDAIHIMTALGSKLGLFNTFDKPLIKKSGLLGGNPGLVIQVPSWHEPKLPLEGGVDGRP